MNGSPALHRAIVKSTADPDRRGRVLVAIPSLSAEPQWAALCVPLPQAVFLPEAGDEVVVAFLDGDLRAPICLGSLWNGQSRPPTASHRG
jgi:hypothetical protein